MYLHEIAFTTIATEGLCHPRRRSVHWKYGAICDVGPLCRHKHIYYARMYVIKPTQWETHCTCVGSWVNRASSSHLSRAWQNENYETEKNT